MEKHPEMKKHLEIKNKDRNHSKTEKELIVKLNDFYSPLKENYPHIELYIGGNKINLIFPAADIDYARDFLKANRQKILNLKIKYELKDFNEYGQSAAAVRIPFIPIAFGKKITLKPKIVFNAQILSNIIFVDEEFI